MMSKDKEFVVFLKDAGTSKITRHRVKAPDPDVAARSFSERGLHTLGAEHLWVHQTKRTGIVLAGVMVLAVIGYGVFNFMQNLSLYL